MTVNAGGTLGGNGTVGKHDDQWRHARARRFDRHAHVQGNLALASAAAYIVEVSPATARPHQRHRRRDACGHREAVFAPGSYASRTYTILTAAGGLSGTFSKVDRASPASPSASIHQYRRYSRPHAALQLLPLLDVNGNQVGVNANPCGLNVNQFNVANAIDNFFNNGGALPASFVALFGLTGANLKQRAGPAFRRSRDRRAAGRLPAHRPVPQPDARSLRRWTQRRRRRGSPRARLCARARQHCRPTIALAYASVFKAPPKAGADL